MPRCWVWVALQPSSHPTPANHPTPSRTRSRFILVTTYRPHHRLAACCLAMWRRADASFRDECRCGPRSADARFLHATRPSRSRSERMLSAVLIKRTQKSGAWWTASTTGLVIRTKTSRRSPSNGQRLGTTRFVDNSINRAQCRLDAATQAHLGAETPKSAMMHGLPQVEEAACHRMTDHLSGSLAP